MGKTMETRVDELEQRSGGSGGIGVRYEESQVVRVNHTGEELTVDEFWSKYPDGTLIHVVREDTPPDITVNWDGIEDG